MDIVDNGLRGTISTGSKTQNIYSIDNNDIKPLINDALLRGQPFPFNSSAMGTIMTTPGERIPSIRSLSANPKSFDALNGTFASDKRDTPNLNTQKVGQVYNDVNNFTNIGHQNLLNNDQSVVEVGEQWQDNPRIDNRKGISPLVSSQNDFVDEYDDYDDDGQSHLLVGNESTGRWTRAEHELFLEALKKYGKEWKKVASMVRTRTVVQTRTHAQKYFQKVTKTLGSGGTGGGTSEDELSQTIDAPASTDSKRLSLSAKKGRRTFAGNTPDTRGTRVSEDKFGVGASSSSKSYLIDEDSLGRDSLVLTELINMTPSKCESASSLDDGNGSLGAPPVLSLPTSREQHRRVPQPSPAACGKRKHAELQAAQMLVGGEIAGAQVLSMMKDPSGRKRPAGLSLTISNPEIVTTGSNGSMNSLIPVDTTPGTPWAKDLKALEVRNAKANSVTTISIVPVSTPSDQRNFLAKVKGYVASGDVTGLHEILSAAEFSAQSFLSGNTGDTPNSALNSNTSVSNLMSVYNTPVPPPPPPPPPLSFDSPHVGGSPRASVSGTTTMFRKTPSASLVARSLNRSDKKEKSVLMEAILNDSVSAVDRKVIYDMCSLLLEHGCSASLTDAKGNTALHYASMQGFDTVGKLLLSKGCPLNAQNTLGDTAAHIAARRGYGPFLEFLVDMGANFHLRNNQASSALDLSATETANPVEDRLVVRRMLMSLEPRLRTLILYHEDCLEHTARRASDWEGPDRLVGIMRRLQDRSEFADFELEISSQFEKASVILLNRVHSPEYLSFVNNLSNQLRTSDDDDLNSKQEKVLTIPFTPQIQRFVMNKAQEELKNSDACDTSFSVGTLTAARRAAGAVAHAVDCVLLGRNRNAFCVVRPPGHHAGYNGLLDGGFSCGFCIFNSVAAGALHALEEHNCERVAIVDFDIHHGNGTEDIVRRYPQPSRLFFFSLHLYDKESPTVTASGTVPGFQFYPGSGATDDTIHNIINVPIPPLWKDDIASPIASPSIQSKETTHIENISSSSVSSSSSSPHSTKSTVSSSTVFDKSRNSQNKSIISTGKTVNLTTLFGREAYRQAISQRLIPSLRAFNPDLILMSSGFDAAAGDVGNCRNYPGMQCQQGMDLSPDDFGWATAEVLKIADLCCGGRVVSVLEGGYGEYDTQKLTAANRAKSVPPPATRNGNRNNGGTTTTAAVDNSSFQSSMNREVLSSAVAAHVTRLVDPYGPSRGVLLAAATTTTGTTTTSTGKKRLAPISYEKK